MARLKLVTIAGTRPEIIRLSRVLPACDTHFEHRLVHTGQNYAPELKQVFFDELGLRKPDHDLECAGNSPAATVAKVIEGVDQVLESERPDAVLVLGDTNSCLGAYPAKRRHIPIFHMEAGNRCFDARVPEETNRKIVDHLSDIHLPYSQIAREYLLREGIAPDRVIVTGSPLFEVLTHFLPKIQASSALKTLGITSGNYLLASAHREENVDSEPRLRALIDSFAQLSKQLGCKVLFSCHPRTQKKLAEFGIQPPSNVTVLKPFGFLDFCKLQMDAKLVLSDSGTISEESDILGFAALNLRESHERPEAMEQAAVTLSGLHPENVLRAAETTLALHKARAPLQPLVPDYRAPQLSTKIVKIIQSYTPYVRRHQTL